MTTPDLQTPIQVLLVEDNPGDARLVQIYLTLEATRPYKVTHVSTMRDALSLVGVREFDIVLTDLGLPDCRGEETVDHITAAWEPTPIIVLTGNDDHEVGAMAVSRGCQDYVVKNALEPRLLERTIRYALERSVAARALRESEERFRTLVEMSPDGILLCSQTSVLFANPAAIHLFGAQTRAALLTSTPDQLFSGIGRELMAIAAQGRSLQEPEIIEQPRVECSLQRLDGSLFEAEITIAPVLYQGKWAAEMIVRDISSRVEAEQQNRLAAAVFQTTAEALIVTNAMNKIVAVNPAFETITGYSREEVLGRTPNFLTAGRHDRRFFITMWRELHKNGHWHGEVWNRRKDGGVYVQRLTLSLTRDQNGMILNHVGVFSDITDAKEEAERNRYRANYDALTDLPNRTLLNDRLAQAIAKAIRGRQCLSVLFLDLDGFKPVNDTWGHVVGDHLLVAVAQRFSGCVRDSDTVARLGGDEFVVLLPEINDTADVRRVAVKILQSLREPILVDNIRCKVGASIGIALFPDHGTTPDRLLDAADKAMYAAKQAGKGRIIVAGTEDVVADQEIFEEIVRG